MSSWITVRPRNKKSIAQVTHITKVANKLKVYYITNILVGGSYKYITDIIKSFQDVTFIPITNINEFRKQTFHSTDILLLQYLLLSHISIQNIIEIVLKTKIQLVIPLHDFYYLTHTVNEFNPYLHNAYLMNNNISSEKITLFHLAKYVICPTQFVKHEFSKYFNTSNFVVCPHIDYAITYQKHIPDITTINIGIINDFSECKGIEYYKELFKITHYKYNIIYHIFTGNRIFNSPHIIIHPRYDNENIITLLRENNIHSLLFLNKWAETYCYSLTHALRSSISILYTNIGAFTERIPESDHYFPVSTNIDDIINGFYKQLDYIIDTRITASIPQNEQIIPEFYYNLFTLR